MASNHENVIATGEDADHLVILIELANFLNAYFLKLGKGKSPQKIYSPLDEIDKLIAKHILFLHAISECDTTFAWYNQGKTKYLQILKKNADMQHVIDIFKNPGVVADDVIKAGLLFVEKCTNSAVKQQLP